MLQRHDVMDQTNLKKIKVTQLFNLRWANGPHTFR